MSSKSRSKKKQGDPAEAAAARHPHAGEEKLREVVEVPEGTSPLRFVLMVVLIVFLLVIFAVPGAIFSTFRQGGSDEPFVVWNRPGGGRAAVSYTDAMLEKRRFDQVMGQRRGMTDEQLATTLVMEDLAHFAGMRVSDQSLRDQVVQIQRQFGSVDSYLDATARMSGGTSGFEETLRRQMLIGRYQDYLARLVSHADPSEIERLWEEQHREVSFEVASLAVEDVREEAAELLPADGDLQAWFDGLDEARQKEFEVPVRYHARLAGLRTGGDSALAGLLERYPEPVEEDHDEDDGHEGEDHDGEEGHDEDDGHDHEEDGHEGHDHGDESADPAQAYYDLNYFRRFRRPEPLSAEESADFTVRFYFPFEEVREACEREAPLLAALQRWIADVNERQANGEEVDLEAEAEALGLDLYLPEEGYSIEEWQELEEWGGNYVASGIARLQPGELSTEVFVDAGFVGVATLDERTEAYMPEFTDLRDDIAEAWIDDESESLALEKLDNLRAGFAELVVEEDEEDEDEPTEDAESGPRREVDAAGFALAVDGLGLEVHSVPHIDKADRFGEMLDTSDEAVAFVRAQASLFDMEVGEVAEAALSSDATQAYLVRVADARVKDMAWMGPDDYDNLRQLAGRSAFSYFFINALSFENLQDTWGLDLPLSVDAGGEEGDEEEPEA